MKPVGREARPTSGQASALLGGSGFTPDNAGPSRLAGRTQRRAFSLDIVPGLNPGTAPAQDPYDSLAIIASAS